MKSCKTKNKRKSPYIEKSICTYLLLNNASHENVINLKDSDLTMTKLKWYENLWRKQIYGYI